MSLIKVHYNEHFIRNLFNSFLYLFLFHLSSTLRILFLKQKYYLVEFRYNNKIIKLFYFQSCFEIKSGVLVYLCTEEIYKILHNRL